jgi:outer membrane protein
MFLAALFMAGCAGDGAVVTGVAPNPERSWTVPRTASYTAMAAGHHEGGAGHHESGVLSVESMGAPLVDSSHAYELAELIDIAERTNPETRIAWERARQAALAMGIVESVHAPILSAKASAAFQRVPLPLPKTALTPQGFFIADTQIFLPALTLKWLLFDFGGKQAAIDATSEVLAAANFGFNATHQKVVFDVTRAYYALSTAQGRVEVARAAQSQAGVLQDAAESRRTRGLATLPEVLQARERSARAAYDLQAAIAGEIDARMALLEAMGISPTMQLHIASMTGRAVPPMVEETAETLVDRALAQRPDLLARVAVVRAQEAEIRRAQAEFYPKVFVAGDLGQNIGRFRTSDIPGWATVNDVTYGAAIFIEIPLFDGGLRSNRIGVARSQLKIAEDELELTRDKAARQVVKAYEDLKVALRQREAAVALLLASERSYDAAIDSYRRGVASLVDVTSAETALTRARTADIDTMSLQYSAIATLAFSTGDLAPPSAEGGSRLRKP